jgi:hypothetical protein
VKKVCPLCEKPLLDGDSGTTAYYFETSDRGSCGFIEEECYLGLLMADVYRMNREHHGVEAASGVLKDSSRKSSFIFRPVNNGMGPMVEVGCFDQDGVRLLKGEYPLVEYNGSKAGGERSRLYSFVSQAIATASGNQGNNFIVVHPVDPRSPGAILKEEKYREFSRLKDYIAGQMGS